MKNKKAIILLSGGLDSYVALDMVIKKYSNMYAINFNYGQKAFREENLASKRIAKRYNLTLKTIKLPFLMRLCDNALTNKDNDGFENFDQVWIPNRNGLFINIAACYCDKYLIDEIILGLNYEEAQNFSDNSIKFIKSVNRSLKNSTLNAPKVIAPCKNMTKVDIVNYAIDNKMPLDLIKSCYDSSEHSSQKHCAKCMSCKLLYNAIKISKRPELIKEIFNESIVC